MRQGAQQRGEITHHRHVGERHEVDSAHAESRGRELRTNGRGVRACEHEHRDAAVRIGSTQGAHALDHGLTCGIGRAACECEHRDRGGIARRPRGAARRKAHRGLAHVIVRGKDLREQPVAEIDEWRPRTEIAGQAQRLESHRPDAEVARTQKEADLRLAELVDRLHRVADHEQGAAVPGCPVRDECREKVELRDRRILEFVDEDVPQLLARADREISGGTLFRERRAGRARDIHMIHATCLREREVQVSRRPGEDTRQRIDGRGVFM